MMASLCQVGSFQSIDISTSSSGSQLHLDHPSGKLPHGMIPVDYSEGDSDSTHLTFWWKTPLCGDDDEVAP